MEATRARQDIRVARFLTEALAPSNLAAVLLLTVAWRYAPSTRQAVAWGLLAVLFAAVIPMGYVVRGVRQKRWTDHHIREREKRAKPLAFGLASVAVGILALALLGAPRELTALVVAMGVGLATGLLVTLVWKISIHVASAAGTVTILFLVFGPAMLVLASAVAAIGWARVEVRAHTVAQTIAGALHGAAVAGIVFSLLR